MSLAYRSAKRRKESAVRDEVIAEVIARDGYICSATAAPGVCESPWPHRKELEAHEVIPRSAWSSGWLVAANVRMVCQSHHDWIGDNPQAAEKLGLHGYSWQRPDGHAGAR